MINHSISIKPTDVDSIARIREIKKYCKDRGISFSFIVLKLLRKHYNEIINGKL